MLISDIKISGRKRKDMGDLNALADSIRAVGLLHPVVVNKANTLVAGERRILAARDILKWSDIPATMVDLEAMARGERDENECRKDFTLSERVAIGKAVEAEIGNRQGARTDKTRKGELVDKELQAPAPEVEPGKQTRDKGAEAAGLKTSTYKAAKIVVANGTPELVEAMDKGEVPVAVAAAAAELPPEKQEAVVRKVKAGTKPAEAVKQASEPKPVSEVATDENGNDVPPRALPAFEHLPQLRELLTRLDRVVRDIKELSQQSHGVLFQCLWQSAVDSVKSARKTLFQGRPAFVCPYCWGKKDACDCCRGCGFVNQRLFDCAPPEIQKLAVQAGKGEPA